MPFKIIDNRRESRLRRAVESDGGAHGALTRAALSAASALYGAGQQSRMRKLRAMPVQDAGAPVISVGNITAGGTGKTPVCLYLARRLHDAGFRTGVATRGYGRQQSEPVIATPESNPGWKVTGDEPQLYLASGRVRAVAVDPLRNRGAAALASGHGCGAILLDDGFQFITLKRAANIVCLDARNPFGFNRLLPRGELREPVSAIERATHFWITRATPENATQTKTLLDTLKKRHPAIPVILSRHEPDCLVPIGANSDPLGTAFLAGKTVCAFSAIGAPESFEQTVETLSGARSLAIRHTDHHAFTEQELRRADALAAEHGCGAVVTTEKDAIRIPGAFKPGLPWFALRICLRVTQGEEHIDRLIESLQ